MSTPSEKLAASLEILHKLQQQGLVVIKAANLSRAHRERLIKAGCLQEVMKGWYIPSSLNEPMGDSTTWYSSFWSFFAGYLRERFDDNWCLSPEQSLLIHAGNWIVPKQLLIRSPNAGNKITKLPHNTTLFDVRYSVPLMEDRKEKQGLMLFSIVPALISCGEQFFRQHPTDARAILSMQRDAAALLAVLLEGGHSTIAGRLAGAFRNIGKDDIADNIIATMRSAGYDVREIDPFDTLLALKFDTRERSPYVNRMRIAWHEMRSAIIDNFPIPAPGLPKNAKAYLARVEDIYVTDAYHSLSIEGYRVSRELIERVRSGSWDPDNEPDDNNHRNALAARGYWQAFQAVKQSITKILAKERPSKVVEKDHHEWYRQLFGPSITAGILSPKDLAGYRNDQVFIRTSMHVPPNYKAVRDMMPAFFDLLNEESEPSVRVILGHFFFVYIHPYMDGNGRMGRFLMNTMLAAAGYPWTVVPVEQRSKYMRSLEEASVAQNIVPFCKFIAALMKASS